MFNFLNKFFLDLKKKQMLIRTLNIWSFNILNYKNYKIMSYLTVLINQFDLITNHKLLVIGNVFSVEVLLKKWFLVLFFLLFLILFLL